VATLVVGQGLAQVQIKPARLRYPFWGGVILVLADPGVKYVVFDEYKSLPYRRNLAPLFDLSKMQSDPYFSVVYTQEKPGHKLVVLKPRLPSR
jgi:hypothetical protein